MNTFYTPFQVLKHYVTEVKELSITNFAPRATLRRCVMWVAENDSGFTHFVCEQLSRTQFVIWGYGNDYAEIERTSFDYADVNTPPDLQTYHDSND